MCTSANWQNVVSKADLGLPQFRWKEKKSMR